MRMGLAPTPTEPGKRLRYEHEDSTDRRRFNPSAQWPKGNIIFYPHIRVNERRHTTMTFIAVLIWLVSLTRLSEARKRSIDRHAALESLCSSL